MTDWGRGEYERTAVRLEPAADAAIAALGVHAGDRVLDVACGTGNAALAAARAGASVVGLDGADRLLGVARERAAAEGLDARFTHGDANALDLPDDSFDAAVSVFGVIFADARKASSELLRVVRPGGRVAFTAWTPEGPTARVLEMVRKALDQPAATPTWSDPAYMEPLLAPHRVTVETRELAFTAPSLDAFMEDQFEFQPMWIAAADAMREAGKLDEVVAEARRIMTEENEDPAAFQTTSSYLLYTVELAG